MADVSLDDLIKKEKDSKSNKNQVFIVIFKNSKASFKKSKAFSNKNTQIRQDHKYKDSFKGQHQTFKNKLIRK